MTDRNNRTHENHTNGDDPEAALQARVTNSIEKVCASAWLEVHTFLDCAYRIVECSTQTLLNLRQEDIFYTEWNSHTVEIRSVFESFKDNLLFLDAISHGIEDDLNARQIIKLQTLMPQVAEKIEDLSEKTFELTRSIVDRSLESIRPDFDEVDDGQTSDYAQQIVARVEFLAEQVRLLRLEAQSMFRLLTRSTRDAEGVPVLDLLAGCSFRRCDVVVAGAYNEPPNSSLVDRDCISAATSATLTSISLIERLQQNLFNHCIQSLTSPLDGDCSFEQAQRILCVGDNSSAAETRNALAAIALSHRPPQLRVHEAGTVIIMLGLPQEAKLFRQEIETALVLLVAAARENFEAADIHPTVHLISEDEVFEVGLKLTLTHSDRTLPAHNNTLDIVQGHAEMAQFVADFSVVGPVSFDVSGDDKKSSVHISLPGDLLFSSEVLGECPLDQQASCVAHAFTLARGIGGTRQLRFVRKSSMSEDTLATHASIGGIVIGRETHSEEPPPADNIRAMAKFIDLWLTNPGIYKECSSTAPVDIALACPAEWLMDRAIVEEVSTLSSLVTFGHLNLALVPAIVREGLDSASGSKVLRELREILELNSDRLAPFGKPEVFVTTNVLEANGRRSLPFYLTTTGRGLCAVGSLAPDSGETTLSVFSPSVATKFAELIELIATQPPLSQSASGPWGKRLQDRLLAEGFALSEYLVEELRRERTMSLEPLTAKQAADILYQYLAGMPQAYIISENYTVAGQPIASMAILTKNDAALWSEH